MHLLGLSRGALSAETLALREMQLAPLRSKAWLRHSFTVGSAVIAVLALGLAPDMTAQNLILAGWLLVHCLFSLWSARRMAALRGASNEAYRDEYAAMNLHGVATAIIWAAAFWLQGLQPTLNSILILWPLVLLAMVTLVTVAHRMPSLCLVYIVPVSLSAAAASAAAGQPLMALVIIAMGVILSVASVRFGAAAIAYHLAAKSLREKDQTVSLLLREYEETSADWLWEIDAGRRLENVSPRFAKALGRSMAELEGMPFLQILSGDAWASGNFPRSLHDMAERLKRRESFSELVIPLSIAGDARWWEVSASVRLDDQGHFIGFRGVGSDVTAKYSSAQEISRMARQDSLTELPNRLALNEALNAALQQATISKKHCALMMIDLDRFKSVNDSLGHPIGDALLAQVAARLRGLMGDQMVCGRLGGDEFAVVVGNARSQDDVIALGNQIIASISRPFAVEGHQLYVGASIGVAIGPRDGKTVDTLTRNADLALYKSKDQGGSIVVCYEAFLHVQADERRVMEQELRKALELGEFALHFQPVVEAGTGDLDGFEALLRWKNVKLGQVSPALFIPVAEDARLIGPIGEWVLRQACLAAAQWPGDLKVAVNVSAEQLTDPGFAAVVVSALAHSGIAPHRLEIEVTESVFLRDGGGAAQLLDKLLALGIRLSLDDFGTGYSSLGYLRKTRFSTIKVDRSFVQGASKNNQESIAIIRAVVALADSLGMSTTAEGVETEAELDYIRSLGCRKIQGYYFGRPIPLADVQALFAQAGVAASRAA